MADARWRRQLVVVAAACAMLLPPSVQLHSQSQTGRAAQVRGAVSRLAGDSSVAVKGIQVVLHRLGVDSSGPYDSARTDAAGEFRIPVRTGERDSALYMISSSHAGIAYFSSALRAGDLDSAHVDVMVFDTTTARVPISVAGRHLIVFAPVIGGRKVVEVYDLSNDSTVTGVSRGDSVPVWRATVPRGARDFGVGPGMSPGSLQFSSGEARVFAPLPPGVKQISFAYTLPDGAFPLLVALESDAAVMEILLAEERGSVDAGVMKEEGRVNIENQSFKRYLAFNLPAGTELRVTVPAGSPLMIVLLIVGVGMLIALAATFRRRVPVAAGRVAPGAAQISDGDEAEVLARQIAQLDATHSARANPDEKSRAAYTAERNQLKKRLAALLARRSGPR